MTILDLTPNYDFKTFVYKSTITIEQIEKAFDYEQKNNEGKLGFSYDAKDFVMEAFFKHTFFRFNNEHSEDFIIKFNEIFRKTVGARKFYYAIKEVTMVKNRHWLETEYSTAINMACSFRDFHRLVKVVNIFPFWEYKSYGCECADNHFLLDGIILQANDIRWQKLFPIKNWNCCCDVVARMAFEIDKSKLTEMSNTVDLYLNKKR